MTGEGSPHEEWRDGEESGSLAWVPGTDYLRHWADADMAVKMFFNALEEARVSEAGVKLTASTDACGAGVVRGVFSTELLSEITRLLRLGAGLPEYWDDGLSF